MSGFEIDEIVQRIHGMPEEEKKLVVANLPTAILFQELGARLIVADDILDQIKKISDTSYDARKQVLQNG